MLLYVEVGVGLILFMIINIYVIFILFKFLKMNTYLKKQFLFKLFIFNNYIYWYKIFFENSHAVFSLDFLIFFYRAQWYLINY